MAMVTVEDVWRSALPQGTQLLAGTPSLHRDVESTQTVKPRPPGLDAPRGGDLILVSTGALSVLNLTLQRLLRSLDGAVAAVAVRGEVTADEVAEAEAQRLPLFHLPASASPTAVERDVLRFLAEQRSDWYQRKHEILRDLAELAVQGRGLAAIAEYMGRHTGRAVTFEDELGEVLASYLPPDAPPSLAEPLQHYIGGRGDEPARSGLSRATLPVTVGDTVVGSVSLFGVTPADGRGRLVLEAGATAGAIELARERAVRETVHRIHGDLTNDLVHGRGDRDDFERRARRIGWDLDAARVALCFRPMVEGGDQRTLLGVLQRRLARALATYDIEAPLYVDDESVTIFCPVPDAAAQPNEGQRLADRLRRDVADVARHGALYVGVGRRHAGPEGFRHSFIEARQAVELGRARPPPRPITGFDDLGVYRVLFALRDTDALRQFYEDMLGALDRYDREKGTELMDTLQAYLQVGNAVEVARRLNLHRNSLLYRLRRIQEITGLDLDDAETRLALHLAMKIGDVLAAQA